jgi:alpha-D-ribose 1-methylphosphonate 5-triphosphate synthase subunit PhnH
MYTPTDSKPHPQPSIERLNRVNFRACLEALARPGRPKEVYPLFDSYLLAVASSLLYSKIRYCYQGSRDDFHLVQAMTGAAPSQPEASHYLFADTPSLSLFEKAYPGSMEQPETSATCIFSCTETHETAVVLSGPGIKEAESLSLPLNAEFVEAFMRKKPTFPLGVDLFLLIDEGYIIGLPRTTQLEVRS